MKIDLTILKKYSQYFRERVTLVITMLIKGMAYKYLRHTIFLLGVVCLVFIGFNGYSNNIPGTTETGTSYSPEDTTDDQQPFAEGITKNDLKHPISRIHRRHHTSRKFIEKPTARETFSSFAGATPGGSYDLFDTSQFGLSCYTLRLRYFVLLFLYALF